MKMMRILFVVLLICSGVITVSAEDIFGPESDDELSSTTPYDDDYEEVPSTHMPHLLSSSSLIEATIGESVTFPCDVDELGVYVLMWKKAPSRLLYAGDLRIWLDDRIKLNKTSLVISSVLPKDSGEYHCQISTIPPLELTHNLDVLYPPSIKSQPKDGLITVKEGETVTLTCDATGNPAPTISWKHAGRHYQSSDGRSYMINSVKKSDSGEYECTADNSVGDPATSVITVEVVSAPKVYPNPTSGLLVVKEGEQISISCEATGDPTPVITWKTPGGEKPHKPREENKIVISKADRNHAGSYECIANNSLGIFTSAIIRVQVLYPPEIKVPHSSIHAGEGTNVNISCIVRGEPVPSVMWKNSDGDVIHSSDHYHLKASSHLHMLQIHSLKEEDFGMYECVASNSLSSASESVHIIGTPQVPIFTSKPHGTQGTKYTISWTVNSHTPVDEYRLMYRKKSGDGKWETKAVASSDEKDGNTYIQMYQLDDLTPATSYEAVVTARNKFGLSDQSETLIFSTKKEEMLILTTIETTVLPEFTETVIPSSNEKQAEKVYNTASNLASTIMILLYPIALTICFQNLH